MHKPVLLHEVIRILNPEGEPSVPYGACPQPGPACRQAGNFFIDGTIGSGGHAVEILKRIGPKGKLLGVDWDEQMIANCRLQIADYKNAILIHGNYANLPEILKENNLPKADGLILDLGFSSEQLQGRGFSFLKDEPLDMRYSANGEFRIQNAECRISTAAEVVNSFNEKDLAEILWKYGEERFSRQIAKKIVEERRKKRILTTFDLAEIIKKAVPRNYERGRIHPATRTFQALRIYVNDELGNLEKLLNNLPKILKAKGRTAIISFHSLEDRLVKNAFRELKTKKVAEILTKKPITPDEEEIRRNPRSRSAKMRAIKLI